MKTFEDYTKNDYNTIARDIIALSKKNESELYQVLGHALFDMGIKTSEKSNVLFERIDKGVSGISALKAYKFVASTTPLNKKEAETKGKVFWKKFRNKIRKAICQNESIIAIINGNSTLKDKLALAIPAILAVIGGGVVLGPVYISLISIALAIIIKAGLGAYCEME